MGCHIWFARPITDHEYNLMKHYALADLKDLIESCDCSFSDAYINNVRKSIITGEKCIDGFAWYQYHFGIFNPELPNEFRSQTVIDIDGKLYLTVEGFHDLARESIGIYTYPKKVIHNKRELRRYIGKRYFNITEEEHKLLNLFWKKYPGGILSWG